MCVLEKNCNESAFCVKKVQANACTRIYFEIQKKKFA